MNQFSHNMKLRTITLLIISGIGYTYAQIIDFTELVPGPAFHDARNGSVSAGDTDNDGDMDVLST